MIDHREVPPTPRMGWMVRACACKWSMAIQVIKPGAENLTKKALHRHLAMERTRANS